MRRGRILLWASLAATLAACAASLAAVSLTGWSLFQPDTRYMVAIGRWIIENGELPTTDPLTLNEGLAYTCQQWPLCIAAAAIFDTFGEAGIKCAAAALDMAGDVLVLGTLALALANVRNELFLFTSMALSLSDIQGEVAGPRARRPWALAVCCTAALAAAAGCLAATLPARTVTEASADAALAALEAAGAESGDAVICDIDVGSELELAGLRPLLDTRAELFCPELNGGADAWGTARHVLAGDEDAIEGTGADFAAVPSGAYPALEDSLSGLGFSLVHDDGTFAVFARKPS